MAWKCEVRDVPTRTASRRFGGPLGAAFLCAAMGALVSVSGCGLGKVGECNKLIEAANAQQEVIKAATAKLNSSEDPGDIESLAAAMEKAGGDIAAVPLHDDKLKGMQKDYKSMLDGAAKSCRDLITAVKGKNVAAINKAKSDLSNVTSEESHVVSQINAYCSGG